MTAAHGQPGLHGSQGLGGAARLIRAVCGLSDRSLRAAPYEHWMDFVELNPYSEYNESRPVASRDRNQRGDLIVFDFGGGGVLSPGSEFALAATRHTGGRAVSSASSGGIS